MTILIRTDRIYDRQDANSSTVKWSLTFDNDSVIVETIEWLMREAGGGVMIGISASQVNK